MVCWKAKAKQQFDAWSSSYDASILQRWFFGPSHAKLLAACAVPDRARVLDIGCGTGLFARKLLTTHPTATVVGLDLSESMLDRARVNCSDVSDRLVLVHGDSEKLPFADSSFDLVTCIHSFHHYPNHENVLREMHRVSKPNGQVLIIDGDRDGWLGWLIYDWVVATIEGAVHHCSASEFCDLLGRTGFHQVGQERCGLVPLLLTHARALKPAVRLRIAA
jgi:ubiquinone/menaquinone biosynthesis C-methylase UbiE